MHPSAHFSEPTRCCSLCSLLEWRGNRIFRLHRGRSRLIHETYVLWNCTFFSRVFWIPHSFQRGDLVGYFFDIHPFECSLDWSRSARCVCSLVLLPHPWCRYHKLTHKYRITAVVQNWIIYLYISSLINTDNNDAKRTYRPVPCIGDLYDIHYRIYSKFQYIMLVGIIKLYCHT